MSGELCEIRDRDLAFSLAESRDLLANFGVEVGADELTHLHERSEGWAAALQMAALTLRGTTDPVRLARALDIGSYPIAEYFIDEVLSQQPAEVARFMLDTSVLGELTAGACAAVTERQDAAALLHSIHAANLFLVTLDDERTSFRYHHLVRQALYAELRARDPTREQQLHLRAAEWYESAGDTRRAVRHYLAAKQVDRALPLLRDRVMTEFLHDPTFPAALDLSMVDSAVLADAPDRLLAVAGDLLTLGDAARAGEYLDLLQRDRPAIPPESRLAARAAAMRSFLHFQLGEADQAVREALAARAIQEQATPSDEWTAALPLALAHVYQWLDDYEAVEREAAAALAMPGLTNPVKLVLVPGARAVAWFDAACCPRPPRPQVSLVPMPGGWASISIFSPGLPAGAGRPGAGTARPGCCRTAHRTGAVDSGASADRLRVPGPAGPGRDLGRPRAGPRRAGQHRGRAPGPGRNQLGAAGPGRRTGGIAAPVARRRALRRRAHGRAARRLAAPCCRPESALPQAITKPRRTTCRRPRRGN